MSHFYWRTAENTPRILSLSCPFSDIKACQQVVRMFFPHVRFAEDADVFLSLKVRFEERGREEKVPLELKAVWYCGEEIISHVMDPQEILRLWDLESEWGLKADSAWSKEPVLQIAAKQVILRLLEKMTGQSMPWGVLTGVRPGRLWQNLIDRGLSYEERRKVLMTYFLVEGVKVDLLQAVAEEQRICLEWRGKEGHSLKEISLAGESNLERAQSARYACPRDQNDGREVAVYVSVPFCPSRCSYCTFPGYVKGKKHIDQPERIEGYLETLFNEMNLLSQDICTYGFRVNTVYIGGGTPTVLEAEQLRKLIGHLKKSLPWQDRLEFCCEAGRPDTITPEKVAVLAEGGVNRLCINPQTLDDGTLRRVGRSHSAEDFVRAYELARGAASWHINGDMILGLPGEDETHADKTAKRLVEMGLDSITVHYLTLKRGSDMWLRSSARVDGKDSGRFPVNVAESGQNLMCMGEKVRRRLLDAAYHPYYLYRQKGMVGNLENVGYCRSGAQCLYNIIMIAESQHVVGLGVGASSKILKRDGHKNLYNPKDIASYEKRFHETAVKRRELWQTEN